MGRRGRPRGPYRVGDEDEGDDYVTARSAAVDARIKRLEADGRVRTAALVASTFNLDPVAVLDEPDVLKRLVRLAAHNVIQTETEKANKRASKGK